jgi:1-acyl-sn-glycerol-3-phosphate acyltransferase
MNIFKKLFGYIWILWYAILFIGMFLIFYPFFRLLLISEKTYFYADKLRKIWGRITSYLGLMIPIIRYEQKIDTKKQYIYCANHISYLDIVLCGSFLPTFNFFMAKMELSKLPLFRIWFKTLDVPVKRESLRSSHGAFHKAAVKLQKGLSLIIFPEGKIPANAPKLHHPLKPGAFKLAIEQGIPVVPVTILDNMNRLNFDLLWCSPGKMRMIVHAPIETVNLSIDDTPMLAEQVYSTINNQLEQAGIV